MPRALPPPEKAKRQIEELIATRFPQPARGELDRDTSTLATSTLATSTLATSTLATSTLALAVPETLIERIRVTGSGSYASQ
jgi:hypothetical protein